MLDRTSRTTRKWDESIEHVIIKEHTWITMGYSQSNKAFGMELSSGTIMKNESISIKREYNISEVSVAC